MKRSAIMLTLSAALFTGYAFGATLRGSYTEPAGCYVEPAEYYAEKDGARMDPSDIGFENTSTASGPNVPGKVDVVLSDVTSAGYYLFNAKNSRGNWRGCDWEYEVPVGGVSAGEVWSYADRTLTSSVTLAMSSYTGIDNRLSSTHGSGSWESGGSVAVLPFQGSVSYESASFGSDVHIFRGDSVSLPYSLGLDITGLEVWFAAKASAADASYVIGPTDVTGSVSDPAQGTGFIELSTAVTDITPRRYIAEIELRGPGQVNTPLRFYLWIDADVLR